MRRCVVLFGLAVIALAVGCFSFTLSAQQQDAQEATNAIKALDAQKSEMIRNKDAADLASCFTSDGLGHARTETRGEART